jgi:hypothetical protein
LSVVDRSSKVVTSLVNTPSFIVDSDIEVEAFCSCSMLAAVGFDFASRMVSSAKK